MKQVIAILWQAVVLYAAAFAGFLLGLAVPALRVSRVLSHTLTVERTYDFDWLIAVGVVYVLLLDVAAIRGRFRQGWIATTIALVLVLLVVTFFTQLGVKETAL